jgi:hypothetical protein
MARTHDTARQHQSLKAGPGQPLIAIPTEDGGAIYYTSEEAALADRTDETLPAALDTAGAWSDLDWDEAMDELDRIRHEGSASSHTE